MVAPGHTGPDFLGIGGTRCGTTTLTSVMARHPELWLPPLKEIHYFDQQRGRPPYQRKPVHRRKFYRTLWAAMIGRRGWHDVAWYLRYLRGARSDGWYLSLFDGHGDRLAGEITPAYALLPDATIAEIAAWRPDLRVILMMRDPLERAWSSLRRTAARAGDDQRLADIEGLCRDIVQDRFVAKSRFAEILARWERHLPQEQIFVGFFEDLAQDPAAFFPRLFRFLGVAADAVPADQLTQQRNAAKLASDLPTPVARALAEAVIDDTRTLAARFGAPCQDWLARQEALLAAPG